MDVWLFRDFHAVACERSNCSLVRCALERGTEKGAHVSGNSRDGDGASLSEEAECGGPLARTPLLRTLENRTSPDTGMSP